MAAEKILIRLTKASSKISTVIDATYAFNNNDSFYQDLSGWDKAVVEVVNSDSIISFKTTNDNGSVTGEVVPAPEVPDNWVTVQGVNLNNNSNVSSVNGTGIIEFDIIGKYLQLSSSEVPPPPPEPIQDGLQFYVDAGNIESYSGSGTTWNDISGNNNNGAFNVAPTFNAGVGGYFQLNGGQIVQGFSSSISETLSSKTLIVWFNIADTTRRGLMATRDSLSLGGWAFVVNRTAAGNLTFFNVAGGGLIEKAAGITPANWYMATLTYNYSTLSAELFVNGISVGTQSSVGAGSNSPFNGVLAAEEQNDLSGAFSGGYSIVNIYNRVLTSAEIIFNYNVFADRFGLPPII